MTSRRMTTQCVESFCVFLQEFFSLIKRKAASHLTCVSFNLFTLLRQNGSQKTKNTFICMLIWLT